MSVIGKMLLSGLLLASLALLFAACGTPQGNAEDGKRWYLLNRCHACHGPEGDGGGRGPAIANTAMSFRSFLSTVRDAGSLIMPKYSEERIPTQDVADIYAWLKGK